jgi:hypothetical protein
MCLHLMLPLPSSETTKSLFLAPFNRLIGHAKRESEEDKQLGEQKSSRSKIHGCCNETFFFYLPP